MVGKQGGGELRFSNKAGEFFQLRIHGYEFPDEEEDKWDSNWLEIEISAKHKDGEWTVIHPCLRTNEVEKLARWLISLDQTQDRPEPLLDFMEPNLVFNLVDTPNGPAIRVYFELEVRPPWSPAISPQKAMADLWIDFPLEDVDLKSAVRSLREQLVQYPERHS